jgi:Kef-type K+ transport system membrane component KefB/mannitol/fructose-specific phosphotransferase system IIA component (Ntr-type)/nucleotide-binding universal stress UspA family protein
LVKDSLFPITDPVVLFAAVAVIILVAPLLAARAKLPGMIGLILAGALLGPNALDWLARDQTIVLLGTVGLLYIVFMASLEIDLAGFRRYRAQSLIFGALSFSVPQVLGAFMALHLLGFETMSAVLLASMFGSHTLLAYPIVSRLGLSKNRAVTAAIGGTLVTDSAALLVLAVVAGSTRGELNPAFWTQLSLSLVAFVAVVLVGLPRLGRWFFRNVPGDGPLEFVFVLSAVFVAASLARPAGVEPIIGAFLAGLALNPLIPHSSSLANRIHFTGNALFIPFFLISVGMLLDARVLFADIWSWIVAGSMLVTVTTTKFLAAMVARLLFGYSRDEGAVLYSLSVAQAAATLAATMVGYEIGLFDETVINGVILMILGTCILAPWVADRYGRRLAITEEQRTSMEGTARQRVLVPLANPATAQPLIDLALLIRDSKGEEPILPLTVAADGPNVEAQVAYGEKMLGQAVTHVVAADVPARPVTRVDMNISSGILRACKELRITDIVIGWTGEVSTRERIFGTVLDQLLDARSRNLFVVRIAQPFATTDRIAFCVPPLAERDPGFPAAAMAIKRLASQVSAQLHLITEAGRMGPVQQRMSRVKPTAKVEPSAITSWDRLASKLEAEADEHTLVVLYGSRKGNLSWTHRLDRLPAELGKLLPGVNLLVVYPGEPEEASEFVLAGEASARASIDPDVVSFDLTGSHEQALAKMLEEGFPEDPKLAGKLRKALLRNAEEFSHELSPGVVMLYEQSRLVSHPVALVGTSREGLRFPKARRAIHLVLVVITPSERLAQADLDLLSQLAELLRSADIVDQVKSAESLAELRGALRLGRDPSASIPPWTQPE